MTVLLAALGKVLASPLLLAETCIGLLACYVSIIIFYRLTFHPLSGYPGPWLAKVTDLYLAYHAWKGDRHLEFWRGHEKYGPVVRLGPNLLSFHTSSALKSIYGFKSNVRKSDFYTAFPANKHTFNVHSAIEKSAHARKRRVISHAFADNAIKSMEKYVISNVDAACSLLNEDASKSTTNDEKGGWSVPRNMSKWADWLAFDIMGELVFGKAFGMLENPANRFAVDLVSSAAHRHLICGTHLTIHNWHLDKIFFRAIAAGRAQYMAYSKQQAMERTKLGADCDRKDFFYYLLNAKDPETGRGFTQDELWGESNLFIIAGSDTTSTAMAGTFFYLVHNPDVLEKAMAEVRDKFASVDEIVHGKDLTSCRYLRACIDEAMRMSPPVGGGLPRCVLPGGQRIDGYEVPAGVDVCVPHYAIHHNEAYFPQPFTYMPARWMSPVANESSEVIRNPFSGKLEEAHGAFCPFSVGPRGCIGKGMAYVELTLSLARVLFEFDLRLAPGTSVGEGRPDLELGRRREEEFQLRDTFTSLKDGPMVQLRRRT
jgi:cytochrome P450